MTMRQNESKVSKFRIIDDNDELRLRGSCDVKVKGRWWMVRLQRGSLRGKDVGTRRGLGLEAAGGWQRLLLAPLECAWMSKGSRRPVTPAIPLLQGVRIH